MRVKGTIFPPAVSMGGRQLVLIFTANNIEPNDKMKVIAGSASPQDDVLPRGGGDVAYQGATVARSRRLTSRAFGFSTRQCPDSRSC